MFSVNSFFLSFSANVIFSFSKPLRSNPNESKKSHRICEEIHRARGNHRFSSGRLARLKRVDELTNTVKLYA